MEQLIREINASISTPDMDLGDTTSIQSIPANQPIRPNQNNQPNPLNKTPSKNSLMPIAKPNSTFSDADDIDQLLNELDDKVGNALPNYNSGSHNNYGNGSTKTQNSRAGFQTDSTLSPTLSSDRFTKLLDNLAEDLAKLGIDESEFPENQAIKYQHLTEAVDLQKMREHSMYIEHSLENIPMNEKIEVPLYYQAGNGNSGGRGYMLKILPGASGGVVLQQAIQKAGGMGLLEDFALFLIINEKDKRQIGEKTNPFDVINEIGADRCKLLLEKRSKQQVELILAVSKGEYWCKEASFVVSEGDMFYVLEKEGPGENPLQMWRVKPISKNGKDFDMPRELLEIDPEGWKKLQYKYGQKVYFDRGEAVSSPKSSKMVQFKAFTSKLLKSVKFSSHSEKKN